MLLPRGQAKFCARTPDWGDSKGMSFHRLTILLHKHAYCAR
jgi:hypothetical protein